MRSSVLRSLDSNFQESASVKVSSQISFHDLASRRFLISLFLLRHFPILSCLQYPQQLRVVAPLVQFHHVPFSLRLHLPLEPPYQVYLHLYPGFYQSLVIYVTSPGFCNPGKGRHPLQKHRMLSINLWRCRLQGFPFALLSVYLKYSSRM